jgi:hypothetical protein
MDIKPWTGVARGTISPTQTCIVYFAPREVDLRVAARAWARDRVYDQTLQPEGMEVPNTELLYKGQCHPEWLEMPDMDEISLLRFSDLLNDLS